MFTDNDYMEYLESIIDVENRMLFYVTDLKSKIKNKDLGGPLETVASDEAKHYAMARGLYSSFFPLKKEDLEERDFSKGTMLLKDPVTGENIEGIILLLSEYGYGFSVETYKALESGKTYDVEVYYKESEKKAFGKGNVEWYKPIRHDLGLSCVNVEVIK